MKNTEQCKNKGSSLHRCTVIKLVCAVIIDKYIVIKLSSLIDIVYCIYAFPRMSWAIMRVGSTSSCMHGDKWKVIMSLKLGDQALVLILTGYELQT